MTLAQQIKHLRKEKGWSQQKLAQEAGLSLTGITKMEQGITTDPVISSLRKIADALGVSLDQVIGRIIPKK